MVDPLFEHGHVWLVQLHRVLAVSLLSRTSTGPVGSRIVIATTGNYLSQGETETRTITAISSNGTVLTLDSPLTFAHLGVTRQVGSTSVEARAEVGLLSHNVIFQGLFDTCRRLSYDLSDNY